MYQPDMTCIGLIRHNMHQLAGIIAFCRLMPPSSSPFQAVTAVGATVAAMQPAEICVATMRQSGGCHDMQSCTHHTHIN
jgi:hypothetical protein